jgi:hypothetical protein
MVKQDELALQSQYGDLYNEIVRPERKYTISHYLRTQWAPLLGAARLWLVVALRQRCFWNDKQDWCIVDKETLARESGLSLRTVNRIIAAEDKQAPDESRDGWAAWFFSKTRRRRYNQYVGRTVNAPNRYHVLLDDPLTPAHQAAITHYLRQHIGDGSPEHTLHVLHKLCGCSDAELHEILSASLPETAQSQILPAAFVLDIVQANCPMPPQESELHVEIARAASRLHNAITCPERVYLGNQYFRLQWLPELSPLLSSLVVNLRARCYWNERTGDLRDTCQATWDELARELGCTARQLRNLRQEPQLAQFVATLSEGHGRARSKFQVRMFDPLVARDRQRFETQAKASADVLVDPETGQLDMYPLLTKAENSAPRKIERGLKKNKGQTKINLETPAPGNTYEPEVSAPGCSPQTEKTARSETPKEEVLAASDRKIWRIEGIQAEVLACQTGKIGTTVQLLLITPTPTELVETTLTVDQTGSGKPELLAAVRDRLLLKLGVQEPNRGKLVAQHPRCDWIVAWGLYALTQPGLSKNKAGYICNRLWNGDSPPSDLLELAGFSPPVWRLFRRAERLGNDLLIPEQLVRAFTLWNKQLAFLCSGISTRQEGEETTKASLSEKSSLPEMPLLPDALAKVLSAQDWVEEAGERVVIATRDLYQAYRLARAARESALDRPTFVYLTAPTGRRCALNAVILALAVAPLADELWTALRQELQWQMDRGVFARWWQEVMPLGISYGDETGTPCIVLGVPSAAVREWIESKQMSIVLRTLAGVLEQTVEVQFVVYAEALASAVQVPH